MEKSQQWPQLLAAFVAGLLAIGSGIQFGWPSPSIPRILSGELGFNVSSDEVSYVVMLSPIGFVIGSPLSGILLDIIGRKYSLLLLAPFQICSWVTIIFCRSTFVLYAARIIMGISDGALYTALPAYMGEIIEPKVRGVAGTNLALGMLLGILLINTYGSYLPIRIAACVSLAVPILFIVTFMWVPESPYYLLSKGKDGEARNCLKTLRRMDNVDVELDNIKKTVHRQMSEPGTFRHIFTVNSNWKAFIILISLRTVQQLSGLYGIGFYIQTIFELADTSLSPELSSIMCTAIRIPLAIVCSVMIDRIGRKIMLSISSIATAICLAILAVYFHLQTYGYDLNAVKWLPLVAMVFYYIFSSMGLLVVPSVIMGEILPSNVKAKVLAIMNIYFGLTLGAVAKLFQWTEQQLGAHVPFYVFAVSCVFGAVYVYVFVPETKGKSLEEIQFILKGHNSTKESQKSKEVYTVTN